MSKASEEFLRRLRQARERLIATNINDPALDVCISGLARMEEAVGRPLRVVILGEYNSGKTSVADLLIGDGLLPTSVVSNTQVPVLITHAARPALYGVDKDDTLIRIDHDDDDALTDIPYRALHVALPLERLKGYQILDTPSMVGPETFVADADIVIWCTVATRAWTETERATWSQLPKRCRRNALLVVTHKHALNGDDEAEHVTERLRSLTDGLFRDVVLVEAAAEGGGIVPADDGADDLRARLQRLAHEIGDRRTQKAEKIVRRLARLTFHEFGRDEVRPELQPLLTGWQIGAGRVLDDVRCGRKTAPAAIEELLAGYAVFAEKLRPGVVTGDAVSGAPTSRALAPSVRWPEQNAAAARLVAMLASDLTGLLRLLSGTSIFLDPAVRSEHHTARAIMLSLADLDGAFEALGRMIGSSTAATPVSRSAVG